MTACPGVGATAVTRTKSSQRCPDDGDGLAYEADLGTGISADLTFPCPTGSAGLACAFLATDLTHRVRLFRSAHHQAHSPKQPAVASDHPLHERSRRACLHHQCSTTTNHRTFCTATPGCIPEAQIAVSFHNYSRRGDPSSDRAQATIKKISFIPTSRRSSRALASSARPDS